MLLCLAGEGGACSTLLHLRPSHVCYLRGQTLCWGIKSLIPHNKVLKRSEQVVTGDIPNTSHIPQILLTLTSWETGCPGPPQASQRKSDLSSQAQTQSLESTRGTSKLRDMAVVNFPPALTDQSLAQSLALLSGRQAGRRKRERERKSVEPAFQAAAKSIPSYTLKSGLATRIIRNQGTT